jgi:hypothetical protein
MNKPNTDINSNQVDGTHSPLTSSAISTGKCAERYARLKRPVGVLDAAIIKQGCPGIPDEALLKMMFGG